MLSRLEVHYLMYLSHIPSPSNAHLITLINYTHLFIHLIYIPVNLEKSREKCKKSIITYLLITSTLILVGNRISLLRNTSINVWRPYNLCTWNKVPCFFVWSYVHWLFDFTRSFKMTNVFLSSVICNA